jgi:hypothetical protein
MDIRTLLTVKKVNTTVKKPLLIIEDDLHIEESLSEILEPYTQNELLPISILNKILICSFKSCKFVHEYTAYHKIIKTQIGDLLSAKINNWKYNRPADLTRCFDIARYIYCSKNVIDTMLYLSYNNKTQSFDIIDGIHRYTALKIIKDANSKELDLITPSEFGNNNDAKWLYNSYILLNIRFNSLDGDLIELFKSLNKSNPIPDLYIRDFNKDKRDIIESITNNWQVKYKQHFSSNNKPNKPNINRDRFVDLLEIIYDKYQITIENKFLLEELLQRTNTHISYHIPRNLTPSIKEKCNKSGLWLFIYSVDELAKMIK